MTDLIVFGASCVVVGMAVGVLIGLWAPPPRGGEALPPLRAADEALGESVAEFICARHLRVVAPQAEPPCFIDAEALGWLEGA